MLTGRAHGIVCICVIFDSREDGTDLIVSILIRVAVVGIEVFLAATLPKCCAFFAFLINYSAELWSVLICIFGRRGATK